MHGQENASVPCKGTVLSDLNMLEAFFRGYPRSLKPAAENDAHVVLTSDEQKLCIPPNLVVEVRRFLSEYADDVTYEGSKIVYRTYDVGSDFAAWIQKHGVKTDIISGYDFEFVREARLTGTRDVREVRLKYTVYLIKPKTVSFNEVVKTIGGGL